MEAFEHPLFLALWNVWSVITHFDDPMGADGEHDPATLAPVADGIADEVGERPIETAGIRARSVSAAARRAAERSRLQVFPALARRHPG